MKYNSGGFTPPEKTTFRLTILFISVFLIVIVACVGGLLWLAKLGALEINMETIVAILAVIISLSTILVSFVDKMYERYFSTKKVIELNIDVQDNTVVCSGLIANLGHKRILNKNVYLVVSKGSLKDGVFSFGLPLEHEDDNGNISHKEDFCIYSKLMHSCNLENYCSCKKNRDCLNIKKTTDPRVIRLMKRFNEKVGYEEYHRTFVFDGLSKASRLFVDSGEEFCDEIVLNLEKGTYRALIVWIPEGKEDCACSVKYFNV